MKKTVLKIIGIVFALLWAVMMFWSTSFPFIYVLIALAGICAIIFDKTPFAEHKVLPVIAGILLSGASILANYGLFGSIFHNKILILLAALVALVGGFAAFFAVAKYVIGWSCHRELKKVSHRFRAGTVFWFVTAVIVVIDLLVLFLAYYPGILSPDSVNQINQIYTGIYSNHHPVVHTMIIKLSLSIGVSLFGTTNAGVAVYSVIQILLLAISFAYVIMTLYQMQLSYKVIIPFFVCYAVLPYNIYYSFTMWKDVLFGAAMAVFLAALLRIMTDIGNVKAANVIILILSSAGVCLLRSNGWMAYLVILIASVIVLGRKHVKIFAVMAIVFAASMVVRGPLFSALNISKPDILESLAIPMQQIARVLSEGEEITPKQRGILEEIADPDMIAEKYRWDTVDTFKDDIRKTGNVEYINEHKTELLKLYLEMARQHPVTFVYAWIDQTKGYWNGGYEYWNWYVIQENDFAIERKSVISGLDDLMTGYTKAFSRVFLLQPFVSIGLCTWITIIMAFAALAARKREGILAIPGIVIVLTLMVATPISCEFRYAYALFTGFPVIFSGIFAARARQATRK